MVKEEFAIQQMEEIDRLKNILKKVREIVSSFVLFKEYTKEDYDRKMREINEILEQEGF